MLMVAVHVVHANRYNDQICKRDYGEQTEDEGEAVDGWIFCNRIVFGGEMVE